MRAEAGLSGRGVAEALGWPPSKVSKLEHGRQTPTNEDLAAWARIVGQPSVEAELTARLRSLESHYASWKRQLAAGTRARQEAWHADEQRTRMLRNFEAACIPGLLQTADYARHMFIRTTALHKTPADVEEGVRARMRRQQALYESGRTFQFLIWESALRVLISPPDVMAGQLDRLAGLIGMGTLTLGIVPLGASLTVVPTHGFWVYDERLVRVETIGAELKLVDATEIALYLDVWRQLDEAAAYGARAHRIIAAARTALDPEIAATPA